MRVSLLYNDRAGNRIPVDELCRAIARSGHKLVRVATSLDELDTLVDDDVDVVAAAGGDGTIATAARTVAGSGVPLAILPFGTANNIAKSIGAEGPPDALIARWSTGCRRPFDLGIARHASVSHCFVEAIGGGLIPGGIVDMRTQSDDRGATISRMAEALRRYDRVLARLRPAPWNITVDGVTIRGDFLLVEVLNIRAVGPNLELSDADPSDGLLRVVVAGEEHRDELARYLQNGAAPAYRPSLAVHDGRRITLEGGADLHIDDQVRLMSGVVSVGVDAGAVQLLA